MNFLSASSNPAGTVLTVRGYRMQRINGKVQRVEERVAYVIAGDAREIAMSLNQRARTGLRVLFGMRFSATDLPKEIRAIDIDLFDAEIAAESITSEERDYFFSSGFSQHEIFDRLVERNREERMKSRADRADRIRADLDELGAPQQAATEAQDDAVE
ncbi:hypothetical protein U746_2800 [Mycolicibacterium mucogenicum 261Sha1.1M5]|nr:hypothetical protein U746_2800 [Mycolicibacterium mucogenicum 261Sha1.1M5]